MHPSDLWDFSDPAASEARFRAAAQEAEGPAREVWLTQVARALGLQERYEEGHAVLDRVAADSSPEVAVRLLLERGRLHRSAGDADRARILFEDAATHAREHRLEELHVDALHMVALVMPPEEQLVAHRAALAHARAAADPRARRWEASLLNNIGMTHADASDFGTALAAFEEALQARQASGTAEEVRVSWWMVAWALRNLGRTDDARHIQLRLKAELDALGAVDPYVDEELALLSGAGSTGP